MIIETNYFDRDAEKQGDYYVVWVNVYGELEHERYKHKATAEDAYDWLQLIQRNPVMFKRKLHIDTGRGD